MGYSHNQMVPPLKNPAMTSPHRRTKSSAAAASASDGCDAVWIHPSAVVVVPRGTTLGEVLRIFLMKKIFKKNK